MFSAPLKDPEVKGERDFEVKRRQSNKGDANSRAGSHTGMHVFSRRRDDVGDHLGGSTPGTLTREEIRSGYESGGWQCRHGV